MTNIWTVVGMLAIGVVPNANSQPWHDTFYQYRLPLTLEFDRPGWHRVPLTSDQITAAINRIEEMPFDPMWFDFNQVKIVEIDETGSVVDANPDAGMYLVPVGEELIPPDALGHTPVVSVPTEAGSYYLLRYTYAGANRYYSPAGNYETTWPTRMRDHAVQISYEPKVLPKGVNEREKLFLADGSPLKLTLSSDYVTGLKDISLTKVRITLLTNASEAGRRGYALYYQPYNGYHLVLPKRRHGNLPELEARSVYVGPAEKYTGSTRYRLNEGDLASVWFAETTVKLTPETPAPEVSRPTVKIAAAANERQSFQIVLKPKRGFTFQGVLITDLKSADSGIPASNVEFHLMEYVPITRVSDNTPVNFHGKLGDPLVAPTPTRVTPESGNLVLWATVTVPPSTKKGIYTASLRLTAHEGDEIQVPLELEVFDFALPEFSPFRSAMSGGSITKTLSGKEDGRVIADYHHATAESDIRELSRRYYTFMAKHKFTPHYALLFSPIGMNWLPPPDGLNVDSPGNYFTLTDWDFTEFNRDAAYYIDELKVNNVMLVHTDPSFVQMFKHLPGQRLESYERYPPMQSMHWNIFRETTWVGLKPAEGDPYQEISQAQYDRLIHDFYRALAENLERYGWLDKAFILVDETYNRGFDEYLSFLRILKSDPLTAKIRIAWCLQSTSAYTYRSPMEPDRYAFKGLIDHYAPDWRENYNWWEPHYFSDYDIEGDREKLWLYHIETVRSAIDCPGVNNRSTALHVFQQGGSGFHRWSTFDWDRYRCDTDNPWSDPWTDGGGNGALAYFYPPKKDGPTEELDLTIVPSARVITYGEGVDDFEYAKILENLIDEGRERQIDTSAAEEIIADVNRYFYNGVVWSQNDAWYLDLRQRMARAIERFQAEGLPTSFVATDNAEVSSR